MPLVADPPPDPLALHATLVTGKPPREQHFAFLVDDLDAVIAQLRANAIKVSDPAVIEGVCRQAFTHDPSGNMLEFNQRL